MSLEICYELYSQITTKGWMKYVSAIFFFKGQVDWNMWYFLKHANSFLVFRSSTSAFWIFWSCLMLNKISIIFIQTRANFHALLNLKRDSNEVYCNFQAILKSQQAGVNDHVIKVALEQLHHILIKFKLSSLFMHWNVATLNNKPRDKFIFQAFNYFDEYIQRRSWVYNALAAKCAIETGTVNNDNNILFPNRM